MKQKNVFKQIIRKKLTQIKFRLLFYNKQKSANYHFNLRANFQRLVEDLLNQQKIILNEPQKCLRIGTYLPIPERQIIPPCLSWIFTNKHNLKVKYFTPQFTQISRQMNFLYYNPQVNKSSQYKLGSYNIKVPIKNQNQTGHKNLNILIVPLICIEQKSLQRIGYGGGYYDNFIRTHQSQNFVTIGIALEELIFNQTLQRQKFNQNDQILWNFWDQPLDYTITDKKIIKRKTSDI